MSVGRLTVVGIGPGPDQWITPEARAAIDAAQHLVGYEGYLARLAPRVDQHVHSTENRRELERARHAIALAKAGDVVAVVTAGDPGVFAMAGAVFEALDGDDAAGSLDVRVAPGVSAMHAAAARLGAPLAHDFCAISLSDNLKPWPLVVRRLRAAAEGDFVIALYNPASSARPRQIFEAFDVLRAAKDGATPVMFARAVGRPDERVIVTTLADADPGCADMATLVMVGSSETRVLPRTAGATPWVYTPRRSARTG